MLRLSKPCRRRLTTDNIATCSWSTIVPSASATTGIRNVEPEARAAPKWPAAEAMSTLAKAVPNPPRAIRQSRGTSDQCALNRSGTPSGAVFLLQRACDARREAVRDQGGQNHPDSERAAVSFIQRGDCHENAGEADRQAGSNASRWRATKNVRRDDVCEQRIRAIEHACQRGGNALLGERKHAEREGEPKQAEPRDRAPIGALDRLPCGRKQGQRQEADGDAHEGDAARSDGTQSLGHEKKQRAPDEARNDEQQPVCGQVTPIRARPASSPWCTPR